MAQEQDPRIGKKVGNYRLVAPLGRGGMGIVYAAEHVYIGKRMAIKILHDRYAGSDDAVRRFLREAWAASTINHPNIIDVTDFGETEDGSVFLVMEYAVGRPMSDVLTEGGPMGLLGALTIMNQLTSALGAAHRKGILHRDLKPENILLDQRQGRRELLRTMDGGPPVVEMEGSFHYIKVLDFGIAKIIASSMGVNITIPSVVDLGTTQENQEDGMFGTPEYMAPEIARGEQVDARTDIYAVGAMFYEMLTGTVPIQGDTPMRTLVMQVSEPIVPPTRRNPSVEISRAAEACIMKSLSKDPGQRQQSMEELYEELQHCYGRVRYKRDSSRPSAQMTLPDAVVRQQVDADAEESTPILLMQPKNTRPAGLALAAPMKLTRMKKPSVDVMPTLAAVDPYPQPTGPARPRRKTLPMDSAREGKGGPAGDDDEAAG